MELNKLQQEAIEKYGDYGILIEALRDAANGRLPGGFTKMGNDLAHYLDSEKTDYDWERTLEAMKAALQFEIDVHRKNS